MTFVYCNVARLLYTRGQSHKQGALFGNNLCNLDIPQDERAHGRGSNTNGNWNSTNTGVQGMPNGLQSTRGSSLCSLTRSLAAGIYHVRICVIVRLRRQRLVDRVHRARRRCAFQVYIASRRSRERKARSTSGISYFPHCRLHKYRMQCIRYFKVFPLSRHLIASLRISDAIYHCETRSTVERIE